MTFLALSRTTFALALAAAVALPSTPVQAQQNDTIFSKVTPSFRERAFMRVGYISANVKTTSGDVYDVPSATSPTGTVVGKGEVAKYLGSGSGFTNYITSARYNTVATELDGALNLAGVYCSNTAVGLGTPCGFKAKSDSTVGTPVLSLGYYLDDEMSWVVEAYLLAAPLKVAIYGDGNNVMNSQKLVDIKLLPPTAVLGKYFGTKEDSVRPFLGFGASYAMFFDAKATRGLNTFVGGQSEGDTSVKVNNTFGFGPFAGVKAQIDDKWHLSLNVGKLRYKTEATLVTDNTRITNDSAVLNAYPTPLLTAIGTTNGTITGTVLANGTYAPPPGFPVGSTISGTTLLMCDLARAKFGNSDCNMGTYTRKVSTVLDNTLFVLSVGRQF